MARSVEGRRQQHGFVQRKLDVEADLDRRLVHHARVTRTPLEAIIRRALEREVLVLDRLEQQAAAS